MESNGKFYISKDIEIIEKLNRSIVSLQSEMDKLIDSLVEKLIGKFFILPSNTIMKIDQYKSPFFRCVFFSNGNRGNIQLTLKEIGNYCFYEKMKDELSEIFKEEIKILGDKFKECYKI